MIDNLRINAIVNSTTNITTDGATGIQYEDVTEGILLLILIFLMVVDVLVITALITDSEIVRSIRWIITNILVAGVVVAIASALRHIIIAVRTIVATASFEIAILPYCKHS